MTGSCDGPEDAVSKKPNLKFSDGKVLAICSVTNFLSYCHGSVIISAFSIPPLKIIHLFLPQA